MEQIHIRLCVQEFEYEHVHVPAFTVCASFKCHDAFCGRCYQRETHTAGIRARMVDEMERTQYRYTTLNTLSHTPWREPHLDHRGAHFMDASALCNH